MLCRLRELNQESMFGGEKEPLLWAMWGHKGCYKECQTLVQHGATRRSTVGSATCPAARSRRDGRRVDRRLSELLQHGGARLTNPNPNPNPDSDPDPDPDPNPNPNPSPNPTPTCSTG